ncbi:MAG TPA: Rrf2 family transcriptional regulator [Thermomicrobiales bacterium]|nr:Rrf2 family transcriptional regulator [Thermomicrobiales bacterium]
MRVSSRADYGVRALFDLALRYGQGPVQSRDIAARQAIPEAYLHQVLGALNRADLVRSMRGPLGGHALARPPAEITLWDILAVLDGPDRRAHPHLDRDHEGDVVHDVWHELQSRSIDFLSATTLADLVERERSRTLAANYTI